MSRPVLSSRESNVVVAATKTSSGSASPARKSASSSPSKRAGVFSGSPTKRKPKASAFTIYQDPASISSDFNDLDLTGQENSSATVKGNRVLDEQENILQPKAAIRQAQLSNRRPLADLNIEEFQGFLELDAQKFRLSDPFVPKTYKNESNSVHKYYSNYPSFVSPAKNNRTYLFRSGMSIAHDNEYNEDDELEDSLLRKAVLIKHRRSASAGKNDLKLHLIRKNSFTILSN